MTSVLAQIVAEAKARWDIIDVLVVHGWGDWHQRPDRAGGDRRASWGRLLPASS
jgi:hypothetical protein